MYKQLRYNYLANIKYIDFLTMNPFPEGEKLLSHILNAQHIWNARVDQSLSIYGIWQVHKAEQWTLINKENYDSSLGHIIGVNMQKGHEYKEYTGDFLSNNMEEILNHILMHSAYHRGQIASKAEQEGFSPPKTDYMDFLHSNWSESDATSLPSQQ